MKDPTQIPKLVAALGPATEQKMPRIYTCQWCGVKLSEIEADGKECPYCGNAFRSVRPTYEEQPEPAAAAPVPAQEKCSNFAPAGYSGHWREWHRGHGCELDAAPTDPHQSEVVHLHHRGDRRARRGR
jgi:hypothetical protein